MKTDEVFTYHSLFWFIRETKSMNFLIQELQEATNDHFILSADRLSYLSTTIFM